jgi:hypothetical protein
MFAEAHDLAPDGTAPELVPVVRLEPRPRHPPQAARDRPGPGEGAIRRRRAPTRPRSSKAGASATVSLTDPNEDYYGGSGRPADGGVDRIAYWHHPGFAWAARREALDVLGGLFDVAVVGEADYIMAKALVGEAPTSSTPASPPATGRPSDWQAQALKLRGDLGYVPGTVLHHWHGKKAAGNTGPLQDPHRDPVRPGHRPRRDWQGLYRLVDHGDARSVGSGTRSGNTSDQGTRTRSTYELLGGLGTLFVGVSTVIREVRLWRDRPAAAVATVAAGAAR